MSMRIADYQILFNDSQKMLEHAVRDLIGKGWQPLGAVSISHNATSVFYAQAMVRYEDRSPAA